MIAGTGMSVAADRWGEPNRRCPQQINLAVFCYPRSRVIITSHQRLTRVAGGCIG